MEQHEKALEEIISERIREMEKPDYIFPERMNGKDWFLIIAGILLCTALLLQGYLAA